MMPGMMREIWKKAGAKLSAGRPGRNAGRGGKKKWILLGAVLLAAGGGFFFVKSRAAKEADAQAAQIRTAAVTRTDIQSTLSASGTIEPRDTYTITSMAEGEVIEAPFEEGDEVTEGQILYRIDASSMESRLSSASHSLSRAQNNYETALADYNEAASDYSGNTYKATKSGYIKTLYIERGDRVSSGTQIADLYNDAVMEIRVPFLNVEADQIAAGQPAILILSDTLEQVAGTVKSVSSLNETLTGGRLIRYVTIEVANPGGLTDTTAATAVIGEYFSSGDGTFEPTVDTVMAADLSSSVEVESLLVDEGSYVDEGTPIFVMEQSSAEKLLQNYQDALDQAESSLESAQSDLDSTQDTYDDYTITAPISGTVITKSVKAGDNVQNNSGTTSMAVIYDLSSVSFQMNIDELDISDVKTGQRVEVTADAFEDQVFSGEVTNVSLEGTSSNGVTYYPVTVTLSEAGSLLPGMNVEGTIILDSAENALAVPADSLMRGNLVYVRDDSATQAQGNVPAGFRAGEVEPGLISADYVEIVSGGLEEGDEVYVAASSVESSGFDGMPAGMGGMGAPGGMEGGPGGMEGGPGGRGGSGGGPGGPGGF